MGSIAVAPSNGQVIYAGTGEANNSGDSFAGMGILVSTDGGATWTLTGNNVMNRLSVGRIAISATDPNTAYAAVSRGDRGVGSTTGIYKTTNGGATWTDTTGAITTTQDFSDVVVNPTNASIVYAALGTNYGASQNGVYKSTDGGTTWAISGNFPAGIANGRIALAISASNPSEVVASVSNPATGGLLYLLKSTDAGATWVNQTATPDYMGGGNGSGQGWYDNTVAISPTDPNVIYAAGVVTYANNSKGVVASTDGGATWTDLTIDSTSGEPHTDHHATAFDAAGHLILGNDGGVWRLDSPPGGSVPFRWTDVNGNLQITQFTNVSYDPSNANVLLGGSQDNGTEKFDDNLAWAQVFGGDGGYTAIDPTNDQTLYTENYGISLRRSTDGGTTFRSITTGINTSDPANFYVSYTLDPSNHFHLLYGTNRLYSSTDEGTSWTAITAPNTAGWNSSSTVDAISIAPSDPNTIYSSTDDGKIFVSRDAGATWTERDVPNTTGVFNQILIDPANPLSALMARANYNNGGNVGQVFSTVDGGATWVNVSGNLPAIPTWSVARDTRAGSARIYAGTDAGVYDSTDGGTTWSKFKAGMPDAQVVSLNLDPNLNILMAGTHGRGVFEIKATDSISVIAEPITPTEGIAFTNTQVAQFNDSTGNKPISSYTAVIDWGDGTTPSVGTITDLGNGYYGVYGSHTYATYGTYTLEVTVTGPGGGSNVGVATETVTVADAPLTATPLTFNTAVGQTYTGPVGSFTSADPSAPISQYSASINWGDGAITSGILTAGSPAGSFVVSGTHSYLTYGTYSVVITVTSAGGLTTTINSKAIVADAALTAQGVNFTSVEGSTFLGTVATFTSADARALASNYTVTVDWGDGSTLSSTPASVSVLNVGTMFQVSSTHIYKEYGSYTVTTKVTSAGGTSVTATSTATVTDAPIVGTGLAVMTTLGVPFNGLVATITDRNPYGLLSDLSATVDFGDGSGPSAATIVAGTTAGSFRISGSHTFGAAGTTLTKIVVTDKGGSTLTLTGTATVQDAAIAVTGDALFGVAGTALTGLVATFTDAYPLALVSQFSASIDWGDGSSQSAGVVTQPGGPGTTFDVTAGHTYAASGSYVTTITVSDTAGTSAQGTGGVTVSDAALTVIPVPVPPPVYEGSTFGGEIATFVSANNLAPASSFIASVSWGDGTTSNATVTPDPTNTGVYDVKPTTPHTFGATGVYTITVSVVSLGGAQASGSETVDVLDAPIVPTAVPISTTAGATFSGSVATFTQYSLSPASDFTATIAWGDGHTTTGTVTAGTNGVFTVSGTNVYTESGKYTAAVTISTISGTTASVDSPATVADPAITATAGSVSALAGVAFNGTVASFTDPDFYYSAGEFTAKIVWGDGSSPTAGTITGGAGSFTVTGSHTYATPSSGIPFTVLITHVGGMPGVLGSSTTVTGSARILTRLLGAIEASSDTGVSSSDGITRDTTPIYAGTGQVGATVTVYATPAGGSPKAVGSGLINSSGNWVVQLSALSDGAYTVTASMTDPATGVTVETTGLKSSAGGGSLVVDTRGPVVNGVSFTLGTGRLVVTMTDPGAGMNPAGVANAANFAFGLPVGLAFRTYSPSSISAVHTTGTTYVTTLGYNLGKRPTAGGYVITIHAAGITDLAGNTLNEQTFVTFPQIGNSPNPDYVAKLVVARNGSSSTPLPYVSLAEQIAAYRYSHNAEVHKVVRVPSTAAARAVAAAAVKAASLPKVSSFAKKK